MLEFKDGWIWCLKRYILYLKDWKLRLKDGWIWSLKRGFFVKKRWTWSIKVWDWRWMIFKLKRLNFKFENVEYYDSKAGTWS